MSNEDRRLLCQRIRTWIIPLIVAIIGILPFILKSPDFSLSVNQVTGATNPGGVEKIEVNIGRICWYKYPVTLCAEEYPPGTEITFLPIGEPRIPYSSTMTMEVGSDVPEGQHTIEIIGIGGDGKEHTCRYVLYVKLISDNGEPPPMFVGSRESDVYHDPNCRYVNMINAENIIWFTSAEDARAHGYRPCRVCRPPE